MDLCKNSKIFSNRVCSLDSFLLQKEEKERKGVRRVKKVKRKVKKEKTGDQSEEKDQITLTPSDMYRRR